jgi:hypothetical protein
VSVATALDPIEVMDPEGGTVRLAELWSERPVVLAFIRHFG